jgi:hypothetical protein
LSLTRAPRRVTPRGRSTTPVLIVRFLRLGDEIAVCF